MAGLPVSSIFQHFQLLLGELHQVAMPHDVIARHYNCKHGLWMANPTRLA